MQLLPEPLIGVPIAVSVGITSLLIIWLYNLGIQVLSPNLFANKARFPLLSIPFFILAGISMERISRAALPFILALIAPLMIVTYIPRLSLRLPRLFGLR